MKQREKTLAGLFLKYMTLFCVSTVLLIGVVFLLLLCAASVGLLLPANYAESHLTEHEAQICSEEGPPERWIPDGCTYGLYRGDGVWLAGNFPEQERQKAWNQYEKGHIYSEYKGYYRFLELDSGKVCIVKYHLSMRYACNRLNEFLPAPEALMPFLDVLLVVLNAVVLSQRFANRLKPQLQQLQSVTEKIAGNDLEFEPEYSDIKEINGILASLGRLKEELQNSLKSQWDMEQQKQEQLSALAHDIKTPLTVIRGNAELLKEQDLPEESLECASYILANADEMEQYLETMKQVMRGAEPGEEAVVLSCRELGGLFCEAARQLSAAEQLPVVVDNCPQEGTVRCRKADVLRAWENLISNAAERTDRQRGMEILVRTEVRENRRYLAALVRDFGAGFSEKDLRYAERAFYSGDVSRHDRRHSGLGLSIAKKFAEEQGGFLEYGNAGSGAGAVAGVWLRLEE